MAPASFWAFLVDDVGKPGAVLRAQALPVPEAFVWGGASRASVLMPPSGAPRTPYQPRTWFPTFATQLAFFSFFGLRRHPSTGDADPGALRARVMEVTRAPPGPFPFVQW